MLQVCINKSVLAILFLEQVCRSDILQKKELAGKAILSRFGCYFYILWNGEDWWKKRLGVEPERKVFSSGQASEAVNHPSAQGWNVEKGFWSF